MAKRNSHTKPVIISLEAEEDILHIADYLSITWGDKVVKNFLQKLRDFYQVVATHPHLFSYYNKRKNIRKFVVQKQTILFYRGTGTTINILAVFDSRQKPATIKKIISGRKN